MSTVALSDSAPVDPDDELLVAYLDGELDRKQQSDLENRLLEDVELRQRLQQLQTGWELLDDLPDPSPSLKLVESTLELAVSEILKSGPQKPSFWSRFRFPIFVAGLCLAVVLCALAIVWRQNAMAYRQQLVDLAVAEDIDAYTYGRDLELMRQLSANPDWQTMVSASREIGDIRVKSIAGLSAIPVEEREQTIANLAHGKVDQLNSRWKRFTRLDEQGRNEIRRTAQAVQEQADSEFLLKTMQAYSLWRDRLPPELRQAIESSEGKERREAIKEAIDLTQLSISKRSSVKLGEDSIEVIYAALQHIVLQRVSDGDRPTIEFLERSKGRTENSDSEYWMIYMTVMAGGQRGPGGPGGRRPSPFSGRGGVRLAPLQPDELQMIAWALSGDRALDILDSVAQSDPLKETTTLQIWAEEAVRRKFPYKRDDSTPLARYRELGTNERDILDLLPPKDILRELAPENRRFRLPPPR